MTDYYEENSPYEVKVEEEVVYRDTNEQLVSSHFIWFFAHVDYTGTYDNNGKWWWIGGSNAHILYYFFDNLGKKIEIPLWNKVEYIDRTIYSIRDEKNVLESIQNGKKTKSAQEWLDKLYPNKQEVTEISLSELSNVAVDKKGELKVEDFPNLRVIEKKYGNIHGINKVVIANCPQLEKIDISNFKENKELNVNNCPKVSYLNCSDNSFININFLEYFTGLTESNISNCPLFSDLLFLKVMTGLREKSTSTILMLKED